MGKYDKLRQKLLKGASDADIGFSDKAYQVKQVRNLILKYRLGGHDVD